MNPFLSRICPAFVVLVAILQTSMPGRAQEGESIAGKFKNLFHSSRYKLVEKVDLQFETYHPQGMTIIDDKIYMTSVEVVDRAKGDGNGHLFEFSLQGRLIRSLKWRDGPRYHPSGMDFDGRYLWVALAEYSPNSSSTVYRISPDTMKQESIFTFPDHLGAVLHQKDTNTLLGLSWGSRTIYRWEMSSDGMPKDVSRPKEDTNANHFIDFQDGQSLAGTPYALLGGLKGYRKPGRDGASLNMGGIELYDLRSGTAAHQVPLQLWSDKGRPMNQNPFYVQNSADGLRFFFIPDDNSSTLYIYESKLQDP